MAKVIALSNILYGDKDGGRKSFSPGDEITGVAVDNVRQLIASGAAAKVEKPVKVENDDPTIVRDTIMVMAGQYPSTIDRPAAVGNVPINVVSGEDAEKLAALEAENKRLKEELAAAKKANESAK